jgi:CBS domain-containing protein
MMKVMDVLKSKDDNIWSITSQETAYKALEIMSDKDIGALLVIDEGQLVGIFSERDYARKVILKGKSSRETTVGELMTTPVFSISHDKSIDECMALMITARSRHMPVMEAGKLVGVVTMGDVVSVTIAEQKIEIDDLKNYVTGGYSSEMTIY